MTKKYSLKHPLQKRIIDILTHREFARFSDLKLSKTDTNVFSYHLKILQVAGLIKKVGNEYTLSQKSSSYIENLTNNLPKIITMLLIQNSDGDILLTKRHKQPYINTWTLPYGKVKVDDGTVNQSGVRIAHEKLGLSNQPLSHVGDAYIRVCIDDEHFLATLVHVLRFNRDNITASDTLQWIQPHKLPEISLAPGVEAIVARSFFGDDFFFEEFDTELYTKNKK